MSKVEVKRKSLVERRGETSTNCNKSLISFWFYTAPIRPKVELRKLTNPVFFASRAGDLSSTYEHTQMRL